MRDGMSGVKDMNENYYSAPRSSGPSRLSRNKWLSTGSSAFVFPSPASLSFLYLVVLAQHPESDAEYG